MSVVLPEDERNTGDVNDGHDPNEMSSGSAQVMEGELEEPEVFQQNLSQAKEDVLKSLGLPPHADDQESEGARMELDIEDSKNDTKLDMTFLSSMNFGDQKSEGARMELDIEDSKNDTKLDTTFLSSMNFGKRNFFKGVKWAPDGLCFMSCSEDNIIRLINTPNDVLSQNWGEESLVSLKMEACLEIKEAEVIYDYKWWPLMNSSYPETCCFATTAKDQPIHLWDAFNGELRASYIAKNNVDEVHAANCVGFSPDGLQMICGFTKELRLFYIDHPGSSCEVWPTRKHKKSSGQRGIISTAEFSPDGEMIGCGSYDGTTALYSSKNGDLVGIFNSKSKGVTHVKFSPDGYRLYAGSRMNNSIECWDLRYTNGNLFHLERTVETNQRLYFDIASKNCAKKNLVTEDLVVSGSTDGMVSFWDISQLLQINGEAGNTKSTTDPILQFMAHSDCVNGVDFHPFLPVLATSSGQRHFVNPCNSESDSDTEVVEIEENSLKLWRVKGMETG